MSFLGGIATVQGRVYMHELPFEMQKIFNETDLDKWKAPDEIWKNFPYYLSGYDYENRPIWVWEWGKWPLRSYLERGENMDEIISRHVDQMLWHMYKFWGPQTNSEGERVKEVNVLIDLEGYNMSQLGNIPAVNFLIRKLRLVTIVARFSHVTAFVNTNFFGETILNIVKPVMGAAFGSFEIYGTNSKNWEAKLLKHFPRDQIPLWYGGSKDHQPVKVFG
ncbi:unnamed protein product [Allacma fusca]|uniref:CRAL-TRIO domain-containing protein n=1 Tax=Allacma fusca TaxID=39272 RepID=A0A8J2KIB1_9HEXA|nr:unnamed protein product [Allacma fusca]